MLHGKRVFLIVKVLLATGLLSYFVYMLEARTILTSFSTARWLPLFLALLLLPVNVGMEVLKWHWMQRKLSPNLSLRESLGAVLSGYSLGFLTPARLGEHAARALFHRHTNRWQTAFLSFVDRMMNMICYIGLGIPSLFYLLHHHLAQTSRLWPFILISAAFLSGFLLFLLFYPHLSYRFLARGLLRQTRTYVLPVLERYTPREMLTLLALSSLRYFIFTTQFVLLLLSFSEHIPIGEAYIGIAAIYFTKSVLPSITFMDLGIREGASIFFLGSLGIDTVTAFNASLMVFTINLLLPALTGIPTLFHLHIPDGLKRFSNRSTP